MVPMMQLRMIRDGLTLLAVIECKYAVKTFRKFWLLSDTASVILLYRKLAS